MYKRQLITHLLPLAGAAFLVGPDVVIFPLEARLQQIAAEAAPETGFDIPTLRDQHKRSTRQLFHHVGIDYIEGGLVDQADLDAPFLQGDHGVQFAVARGEKDDGQFGRHGAQVPAQIEAALGLVLERDVDDGQVRQAYPECLHRRLAIAVGLDAVAVAGERCRVILAQGRLILDDRDVLAHAPIIAERPAGAAARPVPATFGHYCARFAQQSAPSSAPFGADSVTQMPRGIPASGTRGGSHARQFGAAPGAAHLVSR